MLIVGRSSRRITRRGLHLKRLRSNADEVRTYPKVTGYLLTYCRSGY